MKKPIKNKIAEILKDKGLTPYRLSKLLSCPPPTVYNWCKNKTNPSQQVLPDVLKTLGVSLEEIYEVEYE